MANLNVWVGRDGRTPVVELYAVGFESVAEAKAALVTHLRTEGVDGDETGPVTLVTETTDGIDVETEQCGFGISNDDIQEAITTGCRVSC